jgi:hypothetical protein
MRQWTMAKVRLGSIATDTKSPVASAMSALPPKASNFLGGGDVNSGGRNVGVSLDSRVDMSWINLRLRDLVFVIDDGAGDFVALGFQRCDGSDFGRRTFREGLMGVSILIGPAMFFMLVAFAP